MMQKSKKIKWTFYIVWGENPGPEKFQFQISLKQPYLFRLVIYSFGICILKKDVEEVISNDLEALKLLQKCIYDMAYAYENKDPELPHQFEMEALETAYRFTDDADSEFIKKVYLKNKKLLGERESI